MRFIIKTLTVLFAFLLAVPLSVSAAELTATSPGVDVLALPEPHISDIDAAKNVVHMTIDVDPDASADFRAGVIVEDVSGNVLETSPQIAVTDPEDIKVPIKTALVPGYKITPEISNNNIKNTGAGGVHSEAPVEDPPAEEPPVPVEPTVIVKTETRTETSTETRTKYVVTEVEGDQVVIEKIVEVAKPVYVNYNGLDNADVQTDTPISDIVASTPEAIKEVAEVLTPSPIPVPEADTNKGWISANTKLIVFFIIAALCVILFGVNVYLTYVNHAGAVRPNEA